MSDELPLYPSYAPVTHSTQSTSTRVEPGSLAVGFVTVSTSFAPTLTTHHSRWFEVEAQPKDEISRDVPNVGEEALMQLDERGVARVGEPVKPGTILIGKITKREDTDELTPEEKLLRAIFGEKAGDCFDSSQRAPAGCFGDVTAAELDGKKARVQVSWTRPLEVGDVLDLGGQLAVVAAIQPQSKDLEGRSAPAGISVKKHALARDLIHARAIGPYDLITQQPLEEKEDFGGQRVSTELAAVLGTHAPWFLWECFTMKSDSVMARTRTYEAIIKGENAGRDALSVEPEQVEAPPAPTPAPAPTGVRDIFSFFEKPRVDREQPEVILRLSAWFRALGLEVELKADGARVKVMSEARIRELSHGQITKPEDLGSQKIFGPLRDYKCQCGKYTRMKDRGVVCEKCGVEVIQSRVRRERLAHLEVSCTHPLLGHSMTLLPVLPAGMREKNSPLDPLYERILTTESATERQHAVESLFNTLSSDIEAVWRSQVFSKTVDSSGVAHLTVDPSLPKGSCRIPREMLKELFRPFIYGVLESKGFVTTIKSAKRMVDGKRPEAMKAAEAVSAGYPLLLACGASVVSRTALPWDFPAIAVDEDTAQKLGGRVVQLHLPMTTQSVLELKRLPDVPTAAPASPRGWLSEARHGALMPMAIRAAKSGETESLSDAVLICALGKPPAPPPQAELEAWENERSERISAAELSEPKSEAEQQRQVNEIFSRRVDELELSVSSANALQRANLETIGHLCERTEAELLKMDNFGRKNLKEVKEILANMGLTLGMRGVS